MNISVFNQNFDLDNIIDIYESLIWVDRYSKVGDFQLQDKTTLDLISKLREDYYLRIPLSDRIMIVESNELKTDPENGDKFIAKGRSLESILERRIVWKRTALSGNLEQGIKLLLDENVIIPSDSDRAIPNFIFEYSGSSEIESIPIDVQVFGKDLKTIIEELCTPLGVGFKLTLDEDKNFVFKLYYGKDRTFSQIVNPFVAFSPSLNNISNTNYFHSKAPLKTITLIGGEGEGTDQITTQVSLPSGAGVGLDRREMFTDASDVSFTVDGVLISPEEYYTQLLTRGVLNLLDNQSISSFDGKVEPAINYKFGVDYFLGDIVQLTNEYNLESRVRVTETIFSEDESGTNFYPTFEDVN